MSPANLPFHLILCTPRRPSAFTSPPHGITPGRSDLPVPGRRGLRHLPLTGPTGDSPLFARILTVSGTAPDSEARTGSRFSQGFGTLEEKEMKVEMNRFWSLHLKAIGQLMDLPNKALRKWPFDLQRRVSLGRLLLQDVNDGEGQHTSY